MRKIVTNFVLGIVLSLLMGWALTSNFAPLAQLENRLYDWRFLLRGPLTPAPEVVIAAIDETSLAELGRWPWDRELLARMVERLTESGAALIVFDILFPEAAKDDDLLSQAFDDGGNVLLPIAFDLAGENPKQQDLPEDAAITSILHGERFGSHPPIQAHGVLVPRPEFVEVAMGLGHINALPDRDGVLRRDPLVIAYNQQLYPSLALKTAAVFQGIPDEQLEVDATYAIRLGSRSVATDPWGQLLVNYYGPSGTFPTFSVSDILAGRVASAPLNGKIVLVGATALGIYDLRVTPFSAAMPGIEKHAAVISSLLDGQLLKAVSPGINLFILVATGATLSLFLCRRGLLSGGIITLIAAGLFFYLGLFLFSHYGTVINLAVPINNFLLIFITTTSSNYLFEERYSRRVKAMFASYVTQNLVNELINNPQMAKLGGERREVSILFADIRGFTSLSEQYPPEEVVAVLNEYLEAMTDVILTRGGTLDKFIGDAILAFWNAPCLCRDHARQAILCAVEMTRRLEQLQAKWQQEGRPPLRIGIGLNSGEVIVGNIGAAGRKMDYTIIGDQVNLCSRVESLTRRYEADILLTGNTVEKIRKDLETAELNGLLIEGLERVVVKGKAQAVEIYRIATADLQKPAQLIPCEAGEAVVLTEK